MPSHVSPKLVETRGERAADGSLFLTFADARKVLRGCRLLNFLLQHPEYVSVVGKTVDSGDVDHYVKAILSASELAKAPLYLIRSVVKVMTSEDTQ